MRIGRFDGCGTLSGTGPTRAADRSLGGQRAFLSQRQDPHTYLAPEWEGAAPTWTDAVIGFDDHSGAFTMLYADARGVCRTYRMDFEGNRWTMSARAGEDFHQRFDATVSADASTIDGRWEASGDGQVWTTDFVVTYRRR